MSFRDHNDKLWQCLAEIVSDEGLRLYDLEVRSPASLRVFIDTVTAGTVKNLTTGNVAGESITAENVTSDDCSRICRRLMILFSAEGEKWGIHPEPHIEVSSPGINRILRLVEHFRQAVGERVKVVPMDSRRIAGIPLGQDAIVGDLTAFDGEVLTINDERSAQSLKLPFLDIKKARVDFLFEQKK